MAELLGTATAAVAAAFVDLLVGEASPRAWSRPVMCHLPTAALLAAVGRGGVRLQSFTGIPHTG
jgi:hypothetical protein